MAARTIHRPLTDLADEELVARYRAGDQEAFVVLLERYRRFARAKCRCFFLVGADCDDIEQEGMIGLFKAARDFQSDRQVSFRGFAELCVTRQVITAIKAATRLKHKPLNQYVSTSGVVEGDEPCVRSIEYLLRDHHTADPADEIICQERVLAMRRSMTALLSALEVDVLELHLQGKSYREISVRLGRQTKSIDNALQRIKRKLDGHVQAEREAGYGDLVAVA